MKTFRAVTQRMFMKAFAKIVIERKQIDQDAELLTMRSRFRPWKLFIAYALAILIFGPGFGVPSAHAQAAESPGGPAGARRPAAPGFGILQGRWVRPDGGYVVTIKAVDASGKLDASYANPNPLPFARAEVSRDANSIKIFLELRAGGYNGSTYMLNYDPSNDTLKGVYYQAVAGQSFDVYFVRAK
jgi:hypothetical protein